MMELFGPSSPLINSDDEDDDDSDEEDGIIGAEGEEGEEEEEDEEEDEDGAKKKSTKRGVVCIHEDGGTHAIFESLIPSNQSTVSSSSSSSPSSSSSSTSSITTLPIAEEVAPGVYMGPTYRVLSCNCASDKRDVNDWCSWCKCRRCGGKNLSNWSNPNSRNKTPTTASSGAAAASSLDDFSPSVLLLAVLLLMSVLTFAYAGALPFRHGYLLAVTAASFLTVGIMDIKAEGAKIKDNKLNNNTNRR